MELQHMRRRRSTERIVYRRTNEHVEDSGLMACVGVEIPRLELTRGKRCAMLSVADWRGKSHDGRPTRKEHRQYLSSTGVGGCTEKKIEQAVPLFDCWTRNLT